MGLKSLTLQMIPWCFHFPAGAATCRRSSASVYGGGGAGAGADSPPPSRVLFPDGRVRLYSRPVAAAEVSASAPAAGSSSSSGDGDGGGGGGGGGHLLCRSDAFVVGRRVPALGPGDRLAAGASYVLLPARFFRSNLSFLSLAASFPSAAPRRSAAAAPFARPFDVAKTESGEIRVRVSDEFLDGAVRVRCGDEGEPREESGIDGNGGGGGSRVCTTEELQKDYRQLVRSRSAAAAWRPKLETIRESKERRRRCGSSGGDSSGGGPFAVIKRRKKKNKLQ